MNRSIHDYENDPQFRALVDLLTKMLMDLETTPSELRAAVMLASHHVAMSRGPEPFIVDGKMYRYVGPTPYETKSEQEKK